jgi:hypothetical protein
MESTGDKKVLVTKKETTGDKKSTGDKKPSLTYY